MNKGIKSLLKYIAKCAAVGFLVGSVYTQGRDEGRDEMFDRMHDALDGQGLSTPGTRMMTSSTQSRLIFAIP